MPCLSIDGFCLRHAAGDDIPHVRWVWGKEGVSILKFTSMEMLENVFLGNDFDNVSTWFMPGIYGIGGGSGVVRRCRGTLSSVGCRGSAIDATSLVCFRLGPSFDGIGTALGTWPKLFMRS